MTVAKDTERVVKACAIGDSTTKSNAIAFSSEESSTVKVAKLRAATLETHTTRRIERRFNMTMVVMFIHSLISWFVSDGETKPRRGPSSKES